MSVQEGLSVKKRKIDANDSVKTESMVYINIGLFLLVEFVLLLLLKISVTVIDVLYSFTIGPWAISAL